MIAGATKRRRVVVTGAAGLIGSIVVPDLARHHDTVGLDRARGHAVRRVDSRRERALTRAFAGADAVLDLAANSDIRASWDDVSGNNIPATVATFEAARQAGVRRVVFASSSHVVGLYERDAPYADVLAGRYDGLDPSALPRLDERSPLRPDGPYAIAKALGEATARYYAEAHGISAICLRIGSVARSSRPENPRQFSTLLTHADLRRLVHAALDADTSISFALIYGVSANTWRIWDLAGGAALGYEPVDDAEAWR